MQCNGTTYVGHVEDDLGEIAYAFCDRCRTVVVDAWDARRRRRSWGITYLDPKTLEPEPRKRARFLERLRRSRRRVPLREQAI